MRIPPVALAVGALAALSGWFVRGIPFDAPAAAPAPAPVHTSAPAGQTQPAVLGIRQVDVPPALQGSRNLFAYVSREERVVAVAAPVIRQPMPPPAELVIAPPELPAPLPPRPRFVYRYIGRFGPDHNPVAAFARDGEILTARPGDPVGEHFRLRRIGGDFVEVEAGGHSEKVRLQ